MLPPTTTKPKTKARMPANLSSLAPAAQAIALAKSGVRYRLDPSSVRPGCIAWMPFASVIKVTHRDHHKGASDGVEVVYDAAQNSKHNHVPVVTERPRRRAWNHPCVIVRKEGNDVWILGITSFKGRTLEEKLEKYPVATRRSIAKAIVPIAPSPANVHVLCKEGDKRYAPLTLEGDGSGSGTGKSAGRGVGGYVKLSTVYKMDWRDLQRWSGGKRGLDEESMARLVRLSSAAEKFGKKNDVREQATQKQDVTEKAKKQQTLNDDAPKKKAAKQKAQTKKNALLKLNVKQRDNAATFIDSLEHVAKEIEENNIPVSVEETRRIVETLKEANKAETPVGRSLSKKSQYKVSKAKRKAKAKGQLKAGSKRLKQMVKMKNAKIIGKKSRGGA